MKIFTALTSVFLLFSYASTICRADADLDISTIGTAIDESKIYKFDQMDGYNDKKSSEALTALKTISKTKEKLHAIHPQKDLSKNNSSASNNLHKCFVVAKMNSEVVTNIDVINAIKFIFFSSGKKYDEKYAKLMVKTIINLMLDSRLQQQYARFYKIKVNESEIDAKIQEIAQKNNLSIEELTQNFENLGINMDIFKKNMKERLILSFIIKMIGDDTTVSEQEITEEKAKIATDIRNTRYHLYEIFFRVDDSKAKKSVRENAESTLKLLKEGFSFQVLSENMSQGNYTGITGDLGWLRDESLEPAVKEAIKTLKPGQFSDIIETRTGYKIIYVYDKASPNKLGQSSARYTVLKSKIQYKSGFLTEKDEQILNESIEAIMKADSAENYKSVCKKYNIALEEETIDSPTRYDFELIEKSKSNNRPAILQDLEDENKINILFLCKEEIPEAKIPDKEELIELISAKKIEKEFNRQFKKMKNTAHVEIFYDRLERVS